MKAKVYLLVCALFLMGTAYSQHYCGFDNDKQNWLQSAKHNSKHQRHLRDVNDWISEHKNYNRDEVDCIIPVVVHIIHQNGSENIPDEMVENAIEYLNSSYANLDVYYSPDGTNIPIRFCLAHMDPEGNFSTGINRVESPLTEVTIPNEDQQLKDLSRWDTEKYMNVWIVSELIRADNSIGIVGNSTLPAMHGLDNDGLIIEATFFGGTPVQTKVFIHETGHYLGLFHTFEGTCNNDDCLEDGDMVCDTPPDGVVAPFDCDNGSNSCDSDEDDVSDNNPFRPVDLGGLGDQLDQQQNYMDYSPLTCYEYFTLGQCDRMVASLLTTRSSLLEGDRCNPPCSLGIDASVIASSSEINLGESVVFTNNSQGNTGTLWYVNEELVSEAADFEFNPLEDGSFFIEVLLFNQEPGCNIELEFTINVLCPVTASFASEFENLEPEQSSELTNTSIGAASYQWYIDGTPYSNLENVDISFNEFGTYEVCLEGISDNCSVFYCQSFDIGTCANGRQNANWFLYTGEGQLNQMIFENDETQYVTQFLEYSENKSTLSDHNGQIEFTTNGNSLFNSNLDPTPNGNDLLGHISSRKGSVFVNAPGSDSLVYLFTLDAEENDFDNGLRYHMIDRELDGGLGDVIDGMKNILIENVDTETMAPIRHCNYRDFWIVYYNEEDEAFISWYVNEFGISSEAVISPFEADLFDHNQIYYLDIKVSAKGDKFAKGKHLFSFNNSTGEVNHYLNYSDDLVAFYDFAPNGKYFYAQTQTQLNQVRLNQFDLSLPADEVNDNVFYFNQPLFAIYSDIQTTPAGDILLAAVTSGMLDRIGNPNLYGSDMQLEYGVYSSTGFLNGFGNYYHAYTSDQIFLEGPTATCKGSEVVYALEGCPEGSITWTISPNCPFTMEDSSISPSFPSAGLYLIEVSVESDCGFLRGELYVNVSEGEIPDLGPDMNICVGQTVTLDASGEYLSYLWNNLSEEPTITINAPGVYTVEVLDGQGCSYNDQISIGEFISASIDLGPDFDFCDTIVVLNAGNSFLNYVWQDGSTGPTYTVFEPGTYTVSATIPCEASDALVVVDCTIGIFENSGIEIQIFPNPAEDLLTIVLPQSSLSDVMFRIFDLSGRLVFEKNALGYLSELDVSGISIGVYILQVISDEFIGNYKIALR